VAARKTDTGGFTERRYSPLDVIELELLGDLLRRGFSVPQIRNLLTSLRDVFGVRLYEAIGDEGPLTLMIAGDQLFVRDADGHFFDLADPAQALLVAPDEKKLRTLEARVRRKRTSGSEKLSRDRRPAAE
jgi:DNA-binding transcriptional MerR regulator